MRPPPYCHVKITRQTRALAAVVMKVCHTLYSEVVNYTLQTFLAHFDAIFLAASTSAVDWYKSRPHISLLSKVINVFVAANSTWTKYRLSYVFVLVLSLEMSNICVYPVGFQTSAVTVSESFETLESIPLTVSGSLPPLPANVVVQVSFLNGTGGVPSKSKLAV